MLVAIQEKKLMALKDLQQQSPSSPTSNIYRSYLLPTQL